MFMVVDSGADHSKGQIDRGTMTDLQVWVLEILLNLDPKITPYALVSVVTTLTGLVSVGLPLTEAIVRSCVLESISVTEEVAEEIKEEEEEQGND